MPQTARTLTPRHDDALDLVAVVVPDGVIEALVRRTYSA
jgi:hypothetical protein